MIAVNKHVVEIVNKTYILLKGIMTEKGKRIDVNASSV